MVCVRTRLETRETPQTRGIHWDISEREDMESIRWRIEEKRLHKDMAILSSFDSYTRSQMALFNQGAMTGQLTECNHGLGGHIGKKW
jgi:hypothetical protein